MKRLLIAVNLFIFTTSNAQSIEKNQWNVSAYVSPISKHYLGKYGCAQIHFTRNRINLYAGIGVHYNKERFTRYDRNYAFVDNGHGLNFGQHLMPQLGFEYRFLGSPAHSALFFYAELNYASMLGKDGSFVRPIWPNDTNTVENSIFTMPAFITINAGVGVSTRLNDRWGLKGRVGIVTPIFSKYKGEAFGFGIDGLDTWSYSAGVTYTFKKRK